MTTAPTSTMTAITTIRTATTAKAYNLLSSVGRLPPTAIPPRSISACVTFDSLGIAVRHQYQHNPRVHQPVPRGPLLVPSVMKRKRRRPTRGQNIRNCLCTGFLKTHDDWGWHTLQYRVQPETTSRAWCLSISFIYEIVKL